MESISLEKIKKTHILLILLMVFTISCGEDPAGPEDIQPQTQESIDELFCSDKFDLRPFASGTGSSLDPYIICSTDQFINIESDNSYLNKTFELRANIDLAGENLGGIGNNTDMFEGVFNGKNYEIRNFLLSDIGTSYVGMFRYLGSNGLLKNINLKDANVTGGSYTGALVGHSAGNIDNCHTSGIVTGTSRVGGMVGRFWKLTADPVIKNSSSTATVNASDFAGGLIGWMRGDLHSSFATGDVTITGNRLGGLVGIADGGSIYKSYATGNISGGFLAGGLVGGLRGTISESYSTGRLDVGSWSGGLVGVIGGSGSGKVTRSYSLSTVNGGRESIGGLVGYAYANFPIENSYFAGPSVSGINYVGGLVGQTEDTVINCYSTASSITGTTFVAGLNSWISQDETESFWDVEVSGIATTYDSTAASTTRGGKTTAEMKSSATYSAWDNSIWNISDGSYPTLK